MTTDVTRLLVPSVTYRSTVEGAVSGRPDNDVTVDRWKPYVAAQYTARGVVLNITRVINLRIWNTWYDIASRIFHEYFYARAFCYLSFTNYYGAETYENEMNVKRRRM